MAFLSVSTDFRLSFEGLEEVSTQAKSLKATAQWWPKRERLRETRRICEKEFKGRIPRTLEAPWRRHMGCFSMFPMCFSMFFIGFLCFSNRK